MPNTALYNLLLITGGNLYQRIKWVKPDSPSTLQADWNVAGN